MPEADTTVPAVSNPDQASSPEVASPNHELTVDQLRERLEARTQDIKDHIQGLKHELTTISDITVAGKPILDHVRARPYYYTGITAAVGLGVGLLFGLRDRARNRPEVDERTEVLRLYAAQLLNDAASKVVDGVDSEEAVEEALRSRPPMITYTPAAPTKRSTLGETFDVAVKTALGFGVKIALDHLTQQITGDEETEVVEALDDPPPVGSPASWHTGDL